MKFIYILMFCTAIPSFFKCKTTTYTPDTYEEEKIHFGSGGGFAGSLTEYSLLSNGQLFAKTSHQGEWQTLDTQDKKTTKQLFDQIQNLHLKKIDHNIPGNMYRFVNMTKGKETHKIVWCNESKPQNESIITFYDILIHHVKNITLDQTNYPER